MAPKKPLKTGGKAGAVPSRPGKPMAGLRDKTVRVPAAFNAKTVDPTNQRGAGQRVTGGLAGGRAGKPAGKIAGQTPKPAAKPTAKPAAKPAASRGITMSGDRAALIKGASNPAGPRAPKPAFGPVPTATEARNSRNAANRTAKGYGKPSALETNIRNTVGTITNALKLAGRGGAFAAGMQAYNTRGGTISEMDPKLAKQIAAMKNKVGPKKVGPKKVGPKKVGPGKVGTVAQSFDKSFAAARKAGKSEFTFQGKRYNTKMK
jgi:hypothetical protein